MTKKDQDETMFEAEVLHRCGARLSLMSRYRWEKRSGTAIRKKEKHALMRAISCQLEEGHPADGETMLHFHKWRGSFGGLTVQHAWTEAEEDSVQDVTQRYCELASEAFDKKP